MESPTHTSYAIRHITPNSSRTVSPGAGTVLIGRSGDNDIVIENKGVPELAAQIHCDSSGTDWRLEALMAGAVRLNGKKVKSARLSPGDRIEVGRDVLVLDWTEPNDPVSAAPAADLGETLEGFAELVGKERNLRKLLERIAEIILDVFGGTDAFILKLDGDGQPQVVVAKGDKGAHIEFSDTVVQQVVSSGKGLVLGNALGHPDFSRARSVADLRLTSVLCCPIAVAGKTIGVSYVGSRKATRQFCERDLRLLGIYGIIAGMLISHVDYITQQNDVIERLRSARGERGVVAESKVMRDVLGCTESLADSAITVLLEGETGTGKDVIAQLIHRKSKRSDGPFVVVNCSSLQRDLLDSELFGHKKGSFTSAVSDHEGLFRAADGGTLFLDEVAELDLPLQAKLLRTLETGKIRPVGAVSELSVDVRVVCATNRDLRGMVKDGSFREDLFYRLNQFRLILPPLRERGEDVVLLAHHFLEKYKAEYPSRNITDFHPDSLAALASYEWPGNVRELASTVHRAVLTSSGPLVRLDPDWTEQKTANLDEATREFQMKLVRRALDITGGNKEHAARLLGIHRSTIFRYLSCGD